MPQTFACLVCSLPVTEKKGRQIHTACRPSRFKLIKYEHTCPRCQRKTTRHRKPSEPELKTCMQCYDKSGSNNPNWRGGVKPIARRLRDSDRMKAWRSAVFERDRFTCQKCGQKGGELHADHLWPFAVVPALALEVWNGMTLCAPCHRATPTYQQGTLYWLREMRKVLDREDWDAFVAGRNLVYQCLLEGKELAQIGITR